MPSLAQASKHNKENVLVTADRGLIKCYQRQFELLWIEFEASHLRVRRG